MTKKDFAQKLFEQGLFTSKSDAEKKVDVIFQEIESILKQGDSLHIMNFGRLEVVERAPRIGRNPKTGEEVKIESRKSVKFKPGKSLLEKLN